MPFYVYIIQSEVDKSFYKGFSGSIGKVGELKAISRELVFVLTNPERV